ncbi:hypothetical protein N8455_00475 [Candidatus Gracilibacteria bacterium]|nr:hypothetical protein [Candidatus Gracilibacteria bacterium]
MKNLFTLSSLLFFCISCSGNTTENIEKKVITESEYQAEVLKKQMNDYESDKLTRLGGIEKEYLEAKTNLNYDLEKNLKGEKDFNDIKNAELQLLKEKYSKIKEQEIVLLKELYNITD